MKTSPVLLLTGEGSRLWASRSDYLPFRIEMTSRMCHEDTWDKALSSEGF